MITVRRADSGDFDMILRLLRQIYDHHGTLRPDLFRGAGSKYSRGDLAAMLGDPQTPMLTAVKDGESVGYVLCRIRETGRRTLFIDDLCVDETVRGGGVGTALLGACTDLARESECYNIELNVWEGNAAALRLYEKNGYNTQKRTLEKIL